MAGTAEARMPKRKKQAIPESDGDYHDVQEVASHAASEGRVNKTNEADSSESDDDHSSDGNEDEVSLAGKEPSNLDTLHSDWKRFDDLRTSQQRRKVAISHGFRTISAFREYMRQQEVMSGALCIDEEEIRFAWQTWELQQPDHRKELASKYGFQTVAAFEEYLSLHLMCRSTTSKADGNNVENTRSGDKEETAKPPPKKKRRRRRTRVIPRSLSYKRR